MFKRLAFFRSRAEKPSAIPLNHAEIPWLLACALSTTLPHADYQPPWLVAIVAVSLLLNLWLWYTRRPLPSRRIISVFALIGAVAIGFHYRTILGRDAGVALLALFMALKPMEMKTRRDAMILVMLGFFLLLTHYFYSQSIPTGLWLLATTALQTACMIRIFGGPQPIRQIFRRAGVLLMQATPFMLVLFLLFPRINGPLWGLPQDAHKSRSGLPESIAPGSISDLVLDGSIAFRTRFEGATPAASELYWRGPVLEEFDGRSWSSVRVPRSQRVTPEIAPQGPEISYEVTLEPHNQQWLLALDAPVSLPEQGAFLSSRLQAISQEPIRQRSRFQFKAVTRFRWGLNEHEGVLENAKALPDRGNAKARALAVEWARRHKQEPQAIISEALQMFRRESFIYTLQPPLLVEEPVDQFLFETRRGFCEHYASAFVFLMRAAGIPARVVAGYQGGEVNPLDGYLVVRQSDAHAWAEVWIAGSGWQRVDPTAAIAPNRVEQGIAQALPESDALPVAVRVDLDWLRQLRFRWEALNNQWNQWVLGYNPERQKALLQKLGLKEVDWRSMTALLAISCCLILLGIMAWALWHRPRQEMALRLWLAFCRKMARLGLPREPWEGPRAYAERLVRRYPDQAPQILAVADAYIAARYGPPDSQAIDLLKHALARLPNYRSFV